MRGFRDWGLGFSALVAASITFVSFLYPIPYTLYPSRADDSTNPDILKQIQQEAASVAASTAIKNQVVQILNNREYSGVYLAKNSGKLALNSDNGQRVVVVDQYTVSKAVDKLSQKVVPGDYLVALGDVNDANELVAKELIKMNPPVEATPSAAWGKVKSVGPTGVTVIGKDDKNININVDGNTVYQLGSGDATLADVSGGHNIIAIGSFNKNGELSARFVYLIPGNGLTTSKTASSSAKTKLATPSATASKSAVKKK